MRSSVPPRGSGWVLPVPIACRLSIGRPPRVSGSAQSTGTLEEPEIDENDVVRQPAEGRLSHFRERSRTRAVIFCRGRAAIYGGAAAGRKRFNPVAPAGHSQRGECFHQTAAPERSPADHFF